MPIDTRFANPIVIKGIYPKARLFNFASYDDKGVLIDTVADSDLAPDPGSTNPFATPTASPPNNYTLRLSNGRGGSANTLAWGRARWRSFFTG